MFPSMKTPILAYPLLLGLAGLCHVASGQGEVDFRNTPGIFETPEDRLVYLCNGSNEEKLVGTNYAAALFYVPGADQGNQLAGSGGTLALGFNGLGLAFFRPATTLSPGTWLSPRDTEFFRTLVGVAPGQSATLQVRVWDYASYPTFTDAFIAGQYAVSAPFNYMVPVGGFPPWAFSMNGFQGIRQPCPEPSPFALLGLGVCGWGWYRRKSSRHSGQARGQPIPPQLTSIGRLPHAARLKRGTCLAG